MSSSQTTTGLPRTLGLTDALSIVVGIVIGAGIFLIPNLVARELKTVPLILSVWIFAGVISFFGSLACAELGTMLPATGGQYVFLREAYGPMVGFLCGWSMLLVARTAQVAWMSMMLTVYISYFVRISATEAKLIALVALILFSTINYCGVTAGAVVQKLFTFAKVVGLLVIIGSAFLWHGALPQNPATPVAGFPLSSFGVALIACLLACDGWVQLTFVAGEIKDPQRNILRALALGSLTCVVIYLLANIAYLRVLSIKEIAASNYVGATVAERVLGTAGGKMVSMIIMISIIGSLNGCFLTSPRIYFSQARDGLFFRKFAQVHPRFQTPSFAIILQCLWAVVLLVTGSYESLVDYALFAIWLSYGLMVAAVIVFRITRPDAPRPYRMWGYPVTPLLFLSVTTWFLINMLVTRPGPSVAALLLIGAGIPVYWLWRSQHRVAGSGVMESGNRPKEELTA